MRSDRTARKSDLIANYPAADNPIPIFKAALRERLCRPPLVALPIPLAMVGTVNYTGEDYFTSTGGAFMRAAEGGVNTRISGQMATYRQQSAGLQSAKDSVAFDKREYARKKALVASDFTPRVVYERAETDIKVGRQHIASIEQQIANTAVALNGRTNIGPDRHPTVRTAKAVDQ